VVKLKSNQSLIGCDVKCFFPASAKTITTHLVENSILVVEDDLTKKVFFFIHDDLDLADVFGLVNIERVNACINASLTSLAIVESN
jgi:hypothetical protein